MNEVPPITRTEDIRGYSRSKHQEKSRKSIKFDIFSSNEITMRDNKESPLSLRESYINSSRMRKKKVEQFEKRKKYEYIEQCENMRYLANENDGYRQCVRPSPNKNRSVFLGGNQIRLIFIGKGMM